MLLFDYGLSAIVTAGVLVYLVIALLQPDRV